MDRLRLHHHSSTVLVALFVNVFENQVIDVVISHIKFFRMTKSEQQQEMFYM